MCHFNKSTEDNMKNLIMEMPSSKIYTYITFGNDLKQNNYDYRLVRV